MHVAPLPVQSEEFAALVERHGSALARFINRLVRGVPDAEDLYQETLLRAYRAHHRLEAQAQPNVNAWLCRIAANVCADHFRWRRQVEPLDPLSSIALPDSEDDAPFPEQDLRQLRTFLERLPPRQRQALTLRRLEGQEYDAIARAMGGTPTAARANVYQAIRTLRRWWQDSPPTRRTNYP